MSEWGISSAADAAFVSDMRRSMQYTAGDFDLHDRASLPDLGALHADYSDWHNKYNGGDESDYTPHDSLQAWGNIEEYLKDRHGMEPHVTMSVDDFYTHPKTLQMSKLHSMAQLKTHADGYGDIPDDDLLHGAALGLLKLRRNQHNNRLEPHTAASYPYNRNNDGVRVHAPTGYGQDVEPWGRYMNPGHGGPDHWERGHVEFDNPLHVDEDDWKNNLSQSYGGATGQALSDALLADGYDGVMTNHPKYGPGEMVDVRPRDRRQHMPLT